MTAEELDNIIEDIMTSSWDSGKTKILNFARLMCDKQKEICAKKAVTGAYVKLRRKGARYKQLKDNEDFDMFNTTQMYKVEKNSILNAPYPDEIL